MNNWQYLSPGIPDEAFLREEGIPMTKQEIRAVSLSKLRLFPGARVYDVGAGSGSVAIECKLMVGEGQVFAVDREARAIQLIERNSKHFQVSLEVLEGSAPQCLYALPQADRIFIGGSGGDLEAILATCDERLQAGGRIVLNAISLDTVETARRFLAAHQYMTELVQVQVAVHTNHGRVSFWQSRNPVTIISAGKQEASE